jgi:anaerobic selenocysteine-containing dehydrogenase
VVNNLQLGRVLTGEQKLKVPIKSMMCWNTNPVTQSTESEKILEGLKREDLFLVSAEHFISDTAAYADILLPASMGAEQEDIILSWGHLYLTYNTKCIESPGEAVPNYEIFRRLAKRFGFKEECFKWSDSECLEHYIDWNSPACKGIDLDYLKKNGYARINVGTKDNRAPHKEGKFPTPSGKCEFRIVGAKNFVAGPFRQMYEAFQPGDDIPELPDYVPSKETASANPALAKKYPLNILAPKSHGFINSSYANIENKLKAQGEQFVMIHPLDAEERGIKHGDRAKVFNDRGFFEAVSKVTTDVNKGIVVTTLGYWRQLNNGVVNSVSSNAFGDMGNSPTSHDCLVEVQLA